MATGCPDGGLLRALSSQQLYGPEPCVRYYLLSSLEWKRWGKCNNSATPPTKKREKVIPRTSTQRTIHPVLDSPQLLLVLSISLTCSSSHHNSSYYSNHVSGQGLFKTNEVNHYTKESFNPFRTAFIKPPHKTVPKPCLNSDKTICYSFRLVFIFHI